MKKNVLGCLLFLFLLFFPFRISYAIEVGEKISDGKVSQISSYFENVPILENDEVYRRIYGNSFPTDGSFSLDQLSYLKIPYLDYYGNTILGEMIVHKNLVEDVLNVFRELYEADVEIASMRLIDDFYPSGSISNRYQVADENSMNANNTSSFNYRTIAGSSSLSNHALGMAIDINPFENPYVSSDGTSPYSSDLEYIDPVQRENSMDPHVIQSGDSIVSIFKKYGFSWGGDYHSIKDYQHFEKKVSTTVSESVSNPSTSLETILLVAGHGLGKDCNHASTTIGGVTYYENKEARILVDKIAEHLKKSGISYEIANEIVGDSFWDSDPVKRAEARDCSNPNTSSCCGYRTSTLGTYSNTLLSHVDEKGPHTYALVLEVHFNGGGGKYSLVMGRDHVLEANGKKLAQTVVDSIGFGEAIYGTDSEFYGSTLGTISKFYQQRSIPTYYLETVFMDNTNQFLAYLDHKDEVAKNLAQFLIEIAPNSKGGFPDQSNESSTTNNGRYVDPYPNIFGIPNLSTFEDIGCDTIFFDSNGSETELKEFLDDLFGMIRILVPVIVLLWSTLDYVKALMDQDDKKMKQANQNTLKRISIGLIFFFLPYFLDLLFHLFGLYDLSRCGIGG